MNYNNYNDDYETRNDNYVKPKAHTGRWIAFLVALVLLFADVGTSLYMVFKDKIPDFQFQIKPKTQQTQTTDTPSNNNQSGNTQNQTPDTPITPDTPDQPTPEGPDLAVYSIDVQPLLSNGITLKALNAPMVKSGNRGVVGSAFEKTLQATVLPEDAPDKSVTWNVKWAGDATLSSNNVSNYLTVTPASAGSSTATVRCLQAFGDDKIIITCTTNVGGYMANCRVSYIGTPEAMSIDTSGTEFATDSDWFVDMATLSCGQTYAFDLTLSNSLNSIGSTFGNYTVSVTAHGGINCTVKEVSSRTGETTYGNPTSLNMLASDSDWFAQNNYAYCYFEKHNDTHNILKAYVENGQLKVEAQEAISAYMSVVYGRATDEYTEFESYKDGKVPYVTITVTENATGLTQSINVKTQASVRSVNMDSELSF